MPKRPISHRLEAESIAAFQSLIPTRWVVREKRPDYGVDLEVEIFDQHDEATGILFNVQLKSSGSPKSARRPRLKTESLEYLNRLDIPTLIVAYCATNKRIFHRWHFEIAPNSRPQGDFVQVKMDDSDEWSDFSAAKIEDTLKIWKILRSHPINKQVLLLIQMTREADHALSSGRIKLTKFLERVAGVRPILMTQSESLQLSIFVDVNRISVGIPYLVSLTFEMYEANETEFHSCILYALAYIFGRSKLQRHAELIALHCASSGLKSRSREFASSACQAITGSAEKCAELAIMNGLHTGRDGLSALVLHHLATSDFTAGDAKVSIEAFANAAVQDDPSRADFRYTLGNHFAGRGRYLDAVRNFNAARHIEPTYTKRAYFLAELGSVLFSARRYRQAASYYGSALGLEDDQKTRLFLGDALLLSGRLGSARQEFAKGIKGPSTAYSKQSSLKHYVTTSLIEKFGEEISRSAVDVDPTKEFHQALMMDALDELSNFNAGVFAAGAGDHSGATIHFLIAAFGLTSDSEAWENALTECLNSGEFQLLEEILFSALSMGGAEVLLPFRARVASIPLPELVEIVDSIIAESEGYRSHRAILRLLREDGSYETAYRDL